MSKERYWVTTNPKYLAVVFDEGQKTHYIGTDLEDLLNEQDEKIKELEEEVKSLNAFIVSNDLEKQYIL